MEFLCIIQLSLCQRQMTNSGMKDQQLSKESWAVVARIVIFDLNTSRGGVFGVLLGFLCFFFFPLAGVYCHFLREVLSSALAKCSGSIFMSLYQREGGTGAESEGETSEHGEKE